jgi:hypothetical protein
MINTFQTLTELLHKHQDLWRIEPFFLAMDSNNKWSSAQSELGEWLAGLSSREIELLKFNRERCNNSLSKFIPCLDELMSLCVLPELPQSELALPRGLDKGVPGRKQSQITRMGQSCLQHHQGQEWLEWCAGKGYLGRILAHQSGHKVTSFEYQQTLCDIGQSEADKLGLNMQFTQGDAFSDQAMSAMNGQQHAVALHACGDLHVTLLRHASHLKLPAITISPCCYHLIQGEEYQPLSKVAQQSGLSLTRAELRIPLQETVTGGARVQRHRAQEMSYRLGFDALCQQERLIDHYMPVPSIKKSLLSEGFEAFCYWACERKQLSLPAVDFAKYASIGEQRFWRMEAYSLVQSAFRRPLEIWLLLDKALYLKESGYRVSVSTFCDYQTTPRNCLLHASRVENKKAS